MATWYIDGLDDVAEALRGAREDAGLTITELADVSGLSRASLYHWEGGTKHPNLHSLLVLAKALGATFVINSGGEGGDE